MNPTTDWNGGLLAQALSEQPALTLTFYSFGILLRKATEQGMVEYPVAAEQVAQALSARLRFTTGLLTDDVLLVASEGVKQTIIGYRKPQKTGIFLEGSSEALRVPLPGMVILRTTRGSAPEYQVFAVKTRPTALETPLYHVPLPNVFTHGAVCWGTVRLPAGGSAALAEDWNTLLGTSFGNHAVGGKSKRYPQDVRRLLLELAADNKRVYPKSDLLPIGKTLGQVLGKEVTGDAAEDI
jgi:PRTRC genetic system protein B